MEYLDALHSLLVAIETSRRSSSSKSRSSFSSVSNGLSKIPVRLTPSKDSSSVFVFQIPLRYLKSVRVACRVPKIVAIRTFLLRDSAVSSGLTTTSERLQTCDFRNTISEHGFVPKSLSLSRLPFLQLVFGLRLC